MQALHHGLLEIDLPNDFLVNFCRGVAKQSPRVLFARSVSQGKRKEKNLNKAQVNRRAQRNLAQMIQKSFNLSFLFHALCMINPLINLPTDN